MVKYKKQIICLSIGLIFVVGLFTAFCYKNETALYRNQNRLDSRIINIIQKKPPDRELGSVKVEKIKYIGSKLAVCYSYGDNAKRRYAVGLLQKKLLPPYIKMIYFSYSGDNIIESQEPSTTKSKINILLYDNRDKKVDKIRFKYLGKTSSAVQVIPMSNCQIYFDAIVTQRDVIALFDQFLDKHNAQIFPEDFRAGRARLPQSI